jgi:hypothetical protein
MQALEKAAADAFPSASKKIESIIKNVSNQTFFLPCPFPIRKILRNKE